MELLTALDRDPVAARHYQVFHRTLVRTTESPFRVPVYLSYRVGDAVYWTNRPVTLPRGETLITDGTNYARARCGNRISEKPQMPVSSTEPEPPMLDTPVPVPGSLPGIDKWSENRLPANNATAVAEAISAVPEWDPGLPAPSAWTTIPGGFIALGNQTGNPYPILTPVHPCLTMVTIQPNPFPGLTIPSVPIAGYTSLIGGQEFIPPVTTTVSQMFAPEGGLPPYYVLIESGSGVLPSASCFITPTNVVTPTLPTNPAVPTTGPVQAAPVPEPALFPIVGLAAFGAAWWRVRRQRLNLTK